MNRNGKTAIEFLINASLLTYFTCYCMNVKGEIDVYNCCVLSVIMLQFLRLILIVKEAVAKELMVHLLVELLVV